MKWINGNLEIERTLTFSWRSSTSYRNQPIDLGCKRMGWFLYGMDLRHDRVKNFQPIWKKRENSLSLCTSINPFYATGLFSYPLKTSEIQRICFKEVSKDNNGMKYVNSLLCRQRSFLMFSKGIDVNRFTQMSRQIWKWTIFTNLFIPKILWIIFTTSSNFSKNVMRDSK